MWQRDPGIAEMIAHFDAIPEDKRSFDYLTAQEVRLIEAEFRRCQDQFEYAARNYFWIITKKRQDIPFSLWEGQVLALEKYYELRDRYISRSINRAVKIMILKGRQLGMSTLIEAMLAWKAFFFPNQNCLVIADRGDKAEWLYGIMSHIYDRLPWWLQPMKHRDTKLLLHLQNPDDTGRREDPGLNSKVVVAAATQEGVGQSYTLTGVHCSEYASFPQRRAKEILEGDMVNAIAENPDSFAFLESTGKGAGTYAHRLWRGMSDLLNSGREPNWYPLFLPSFFERTRVLPPPNGWRIKPPEAAMRKRVSREWVRCSSCLAYAQQWYAGESRAGTKCRECGGGTLQILELTDEQIFWFEDRRINAEQSGADSVKELKQEMCVTAEDAFQISGTEVFPQACYEWVNETLIDPPIKRGFLDAGGRFHGCRGEHNVVCWHPGCDINHEAEDTPLSIWEDPIPGEFYCIGADVAEGLGGNSDYSVAFVNRIGRGANPDTQVAVFRSNTIDPLDFAGVLNALGLMYNEALMAIEYNFMDTCANSVRFDYLYPNLYRWKHLDAVTNIMSQKYHWYTQPNTRPRLHQTAKRWLKGRCWVIRSANFHAEMTTFQMDEEDERGRASAARGFHDDEVMAGCIALYCSHEGEFNENLGMIPLPGKTKAPQESAYTMECQRCGNQWGEESPDNIRSCDDAGHPCCPECHSIVFIGRPNSFNPAPERKTWDLLMTDEIPLDSNLSYDQL